MNITRPTTNKRAEEESNSMGALSKTRYALLDNTDRGRGLQSRFLSARIKVTVERSLHC